MFKNEPFINDSSVGTIGVGHGMAYIDITAHIGQLSGKKGVVLGHPVETSQRKEGQCEPNDGYGTICLQ